MRYLKTILFGIVIFTLSSCRHKIEREITNYDYFNITDSEKLNEEILAAITNEEDLQYGSNVAYVNKTGDTVIPFGKYAYYGTDTFVHFANVIVHPNDSTYGRQVGINRDQKILFDLVMFDNGPEPLKEGLVRVLRNGKMGYANEYGEIVIPCLYDYAKWFYDGIAQVTFDAVEYRDMEDHLRVESDEWFLIDTRGKKVEKTP